MSKFFRGNFNVHEFVTCVNVPVTDVVFIVVAFFEFCIFVLQKYHMVYVKSVSWNLLHQNMSSESQSLFWEQILEGKSFSPSQRQCIRWFSDFRRIKVFECDLHNIQSGAGLRCILLHFIVHDG